MDSDLEEFFNLLLNVLNVVCGLEACHNLSFAINEEFGEIPLHIARFAPARNIFVQKTFEDGCKFVVFVKALEGLFRLEPSVEGKFVLTIHLSFAELWEVYTILQRAEFADFSIATRSLTSKLVARYVENHKTLSFLGAMLKSANSAL